MANGRRNERICGQSESRLNYYVYIYIYIYLALWCGPRIASLPLPRYGVRGD